MAHRQARPSRSLLPSRPARLAVSAAPVAPTPESWQQIRRDQESYGRQQLAAEHAAPPDEFTAEVQALAAANQQLQQGTDHLNEQLRRLNEQLHTLDVGVAVWLPTPVATMGPAEWWLGYAKLGSQWQLVVRSGGERTVPQALISAPRLVRLRAAAALKPLLALLTEQVRKFAADVTQAAQALE